MSDSLILGHVICEQCKAPTPIDEMDIRGWFKAADVEQARDTFRVVEGILEMRGTARKRRKDAGTKKTTAEKLVDAMETMRLLPLPELPAEPYALPSSKIDNSDFVPAAPIEDEEMPF
jgi:hypothetical protein